MAEVFTADGVRLTVLDRFDWLLLVRGDDGTYRLHNGEPSGGFRGYVTKLGASYAARAWSADAGRRFRRGGYKTEAGAVRAMVRVGRALNNV
jgi:hypothetical protein